MYLISYRQIHGWPSTCYYFFQMQFRGSKSVYDSNILYFFVKFLPQEQQQKQLDLILAIGKAGKLWENRRGQSEEQDEIEACDSAEVGQMKAHQIPAAARQKGTNNDRAQDLEATNTNEICSFCWIQF